MSPSPDRVWLAPAKLNLMLHIVGRRADGYHRLQTVFQFLDHSDRLRFEPRTDGRIRRTTPLPGVTEATDLTVRAARALQDATGTPRGADIHIDKRLPLGGGLGGGSSDAATTLVALNQLWELGLSTERLAGLGLTLGADVPVFVHGRAAWAEEVGEVLTPIDELPEPWFVVLIPPVSVSTGTVFQDEDLTRNCPAITIPDFLAGAGSNVFEPVVRKRYPLIERALGDLGRFSASRLTGTGACVYASFSDERSARRAMATLRPRWSGFVARGQRVSPLWDTIAEHPTSRD